MHHVLQVEPGFFLRRMLLSQSTNLRQARHSGFDVKSLTLPFRVVFDPLWRLGSWTDQTHVSTQNIPELRHFGNAKSLQNDLVFGQFLTVAIGIETIHPEMLAELAA